VHFSLLEGIAFEEPGVQMLCWWWLYLKGICPRGNNKVVGGGGDIALESLASM
jgi:hypothetical protein